MSYHCAYLTNIQSIHKNFDVEIFTIARIEKAPQSLDSVRRSNAVAALRVLDHENSSG